MTPPVQNHAVKQASDSEDIDQINNFLNSRAIKRDLHWFTYRDTLERAFRREDRALFYTLSERDDIQSALMVWCESRVLDPKEAQIRLVATSPEYRGQGIGSRLCYHAEEFAFNRGQEIMIADVDEESSAVKFWERIGYSTADSWTTGGGRDMVRMEKSLV